MTTPRAEEGKGLPSLTIGLPVFNGERFLAQALDALLAQTYPDFELIISDNASTDRTAAICQEYVARDARVRYVRQRVNIGAGPNHNALVPLARGRYFKWAAHDDLYAPTLLQRCIEVLETDPRPVLVHCWDAMIDERGQVVRCEPHVLDTADARPSVRLHSLLHAPVSNDMYGVIRSDVVRRIGPHGSYLHADRTFIAALCLAGPFGHVPEMLYFRRDHADRASRAPTPRARAAALDPKRASRWRHPVVRLYAEYALGYVTAIRRADLGRWESALCLWELAGWASRCLRRRVANARSGVRAS